MRGAKQGGGGICTPALAAWRLGRGARAAVSLGAGVYRAWHIAFGSRCRLSPGLAFYALTGLVLLLALLAHRFGPELGHPLAVIVLCLAGGMLAAGYRAHAVAAPMLEFRYYGPVQGRIIEIDRSQSDALADHAGSGGAAGRAPRPHAAQGADIACTATPSLPIRVRWCC